MPSASTRESLRVIWDGAEAPGLTVYGFWRGDRSDPPALACTPLCEPAQVRATKLTGPWWSVWLWDLRIEDWPHPDNWRASVDSLLRQLVHQGAAVAWCGLEGTFVEPPFLFDPEAMSSSVWAAIDQRGNVLAAPPLDSVFVTIERDDLLRLKSALLPETS
jgi:hypothetical protein